MDRAPAPSELGAAGRRLWAQITEDVGPGWELDARDLSNLEDACNARDRAHELAKVAKSQGVTGKGSRGQDAVSPSVGEERLQRALTSALLGRVEMTAPAARTGHLSGRQRADLRRGNRGTTG